MTLDLTGRRIALIGGAGFIGHNLALALRESGAEVSVIDGLEVNNLVAFVGNHGLPERTLYLALLNERIRLLETAGIELRIQDARDYHGLSRVLADLQPGVIIHLAAVAHAAWANKNPWSTFDHSLRTLENALDYARGGGIEQFIYFSSSMVYGNFPGDEVTEETPCQPLGIYGALKLSGEHIVVAYQQVFDLPYTIVRPSALYGERCVSRRVGQIFIEQALQGLPLRLTGRPDSKLDFTYVKDLVQGTMLTIGNRDAQNEVFNLTYGAARPVGDLVELLRHEFPDLEVIAEPTDRLNPERGTLNVQKARQLLGYSPEFPLEVGYSRYINWYRNLLDERPDLLVKQ